MPVIKRVVLKKEQSCVKCKGKLAIGEEAVKDRSLKKENGFTVYYHTDCP